MNNQRGLFFVTMALFLSALLGVLQARADEPAALKDVVKVTSSFSKDSELKLEGSGVFLIRHNQLYVLTSEHVVLPMQAPAFHTIQTTEGTVYEAELVETSWEHGLALLKVTNKISGPPLDTDIWYDTSNSQAESSIEDARLKQIKEMTAVGFPVGADQPTRVRAFKGLGLLPVGKVIAQERALEVTDLPVEFGMSGGGVFTASGTLLGIISHATLGGQRKTYLIPAGDALKWVDDREHRDFLHRSVPDLQAQYFSPDKPEILVGKNNLVKIEERKGIVLISTPDIWKVAGSNLFYSSMGGGKVVDEMEKRQIKIGRLTLPPGPGISSSLSQVVHALETENAKLILNNYEEASAPSDNPAEKDLTRVPSFSPQYGQEAYYELTGLRWGTVEVRDSNLNIIGYRAQKYFISGSKISSVYSQSMYGPQTVQEQACWVMEGGFCNRDSETHEIKAFASSDGIRELLANCESNGGKLEIITVPAGKFKTCRMVEGKSTVWYGPAFVRGVIKSESPDSRGMVTEELKSMRNP